MQVDGQAIEFDKDGFMTDPSLWDGKVAAAIAGDGRGEETQGTGSTTRDMPSSQCAEGISVPADCYILILLCLTVLFASQLYLAGRLFDYSTVDVEDYREYLPGMLSFNPAVPEVLTDRYVGHSFLFVLHVFFANLFLMFFPASKMMHALLALPLARLRRR